MRMSAVWVRFDLIYEDLAPYKYCNYYYYYYYYQGEISNPPSPAEPEAAAPSISRLVPAWRARGSEWQDDHLQCPQVPHGPGRGQGVLQRHAGNRRQRPCQGRRAEKLYVLYLEYQIVHKMLRAPEGRIAVIVDYFPWSVQGRVRKVSQFRATLIRVSKGRWWSWRKTGGKGEHACRLLKWTNRNKWRALIIMTFAVDWALKAHYSIYLSIDLLYSKVN